MVTTFGWVTLSGILGEDLKRLNQVVHAVPSLLMSLKRNSFLLHLSGIHLHFSMPFGPCQAPTRSFGPESGLTKVLGYQVSIPDTLTSPGNLSPKTVWLRLFGYQVSIPDTCLPPRGQRGWANPPCALLLIWAEMPERTTIEFTQTYLNWLHVCTIQTL